MRKLQELVRYEADELQELQVGQGQGCSGG